MPFEFVDKREYVHSTTMLVCIWERVVKKIYPDSGGRVLLDAMFHRQVRSACCIEVFDKPNTFPEVVSPAAEFKIVGEDSSCYFVYLLQHTDQPITARTNSSINIDNLKFDGRYSGSCNILGDSTLSLVANVVEANKRVHQAAYAACKDLQVINLYMKRFPIGLLLDVNGIHQLIIENIGVRTHKNGVVTLNRLRFHGMSCQPFDIAFLLQGDGVKE